MAWYDTVDMEQQYSRPVAFFACSQLRIGSCPQEWFHSTKPGVKPELHCVPSPPKLFYNYTKINIVKNITRDKKIKLEKNRCHVYSWKLILLPSTTKKKINPIRVHKWENKKTKSLGGKNIVWTLEVDKNV